MPTCTRCDVIKSSLDFYPDKSKRAGHHTVCKECVKQDRRERYAADPAKYNLRAKEYYENNKEKFFEYARARRRKAIAAYGGACVCCGETNREFLTFDHIDGWGAAHRATVGEGATVIVNWIIKNNYPDTIRLLCWNCNCSRGIYGYCPHVSARV